MKKRIGLIVTLVMATALLFGFCACGDQDEAAGGVDDGMLSAAELTADDWDGLMWQAADKQAQKEYQKYLPEMAFANAEVFGIDKDGDKGTAYVWLDTREYVAFKDNAYCMTGSAGEAILKFTYGEDKATLDEIVWSADGGEHDAWLKDNFPAEYLEKQAAYDAHNEDGTNKMEEVFAQQVEEGMGVPVAEADFLLEIDADTGAYELTKVSETGEGEDYEFNTEVVEKGKLKKLEDGASE